MQSTDGRELYERVLDLARSEAGTKEQVEELHAVLEELSVAAQDEWTRMATFGARLMLRVRPGGEGAEGDADSLAALRAIQDEDRRCLAVRDLANACVLADRLEQADAVADFGLGPGGLAAARYGSFLWHLRAESARLRGHWNDALGYLDRMEENLGRAQSRGALPAQTAQGFRSRLLLGRGQVLLELGVLDRCRTLAREAIEAARSSGQASALAATQLLAIDRELMVADFGTALSLSQAGLADPQLFPWHALFHLTAATARVEQVREEPDQREVAATSARASFDAAAQGELGKTERLKLELGRCDLELGLERLEEARAHLERARVLVRGAGPSASRETVLVSALAWRLAQAGGSRAERESARAELLEAYRAFLRQWEAAPRRPGGIGFLHPAWRAQIIADVIEAELFASPGRPGVEQAFDRLLEAHALGTWARERKLGVPTLDEVRGKLVPEGGGLLVLLAARDSSHLFVLDRGSLDQVQLPSGRTALRRAAAPIAAALTRPDGAVDRRELKALHDLLLPSPVRERMRDWTAAVTVGFDLLHDLPFGILGGESGHPYAERLALVSLPSLAQGVGLSRSERPLPVPAKEVVLVVGGEPPANLALAPFRFGEAERQRWLAPFAPSTVAVLEGAQATPAALGAAQDLLGGARVLHILAHGISLPESESTSALVLTAGESEDGLLEAGDVPQLGARGLVILSACGSGRGPPRVGDDRLVNLGGAFLEAGASCVVLSRFPVEYGSTLALMEHFHARLAAGAAPAEALRAAHEAMAGAEDLAAFHAASFEVLGLGFEPVFPR